MVTYEASSQVREVNHHYTAARLAAALGMSKRPLLRRLAGIEPAATVIVNGNAADAWAIAALPEDLRTRLGEVATRRGYRSVEAMLAAPARRWEPAVPLSQAGAEAVARAARLKEALGPSLARRNDLSLSEEEFTRLGVEDYRRVMGTEVSARHWRRLLERTVERDGGAEEWDRLELYLKDRPARKRGGESMSAARIAGELSEVIAEFRDLSKPSRDEMALLWHRAFEVFECRVSEGHPAKRAKRLIREFLMERLPGIAASWGAMKKTWERKYKNWTTGRRIPRAVDDLRPERSGWRRGTEISKEVKTDIGSKALFGYGGRVAPAWRELRSKNGLPEEVRSRYKENPSRKSHVPKRIREQVRQDVRLAETRAHGPRQARVKEASISRTPPPAGDWYQGDDVTLPVYYWEPNKEGGVTLWRGQFLLMIDIGSLRVLGYVLISAPSYDSLAIRTLITKVCERYGLPRQGFYFERGVWKRASLIVGRPCMAVLSKPEVERGLLDLGLRIKFATRPQAKVIECVIGLLQNRMHGEPGYVGRDERHDRFEAVEEDIALVNRGKLDPRERFYSKEQWMNRLDQIITEYNAEPQQGKTTKGLSPDEAFQAYQRKDDPQVQLGPECRYLLSHHRRPVRVTRNGITLQFGNHKFIYRNEETGKRIGQEVLAWFNPELPDVIIVTDLKRKNPFAVEWSRPIPALDAPEEELARAMAQAHAHNKPARERYRVLKETYDSKFRRNVMDVEAAELGAHVADAEAEVVKRRKAARALQRRVARLRERGLAEVMARGRPRTIEELEAAEELDQMLKSGADEGGEGREL